MCCVFSGVYQNSYLSFNLHYYTKSLHLGYIIHLFVMHDKSLTTEVLQIELLAVQRKASVMWLLLFAFSENMKWLSLSGYCSLFSQNLLPFFVVSLSIFLSTLIIFLFLIHVPKLWCQYFFTCQKYIFFFLTLLHVVFSGIFSVPTVLSPTHT